MSKVNGINNNYINQYTSYSNVSRKTDENVPAFMLDFDEKGVFYDKGSSGESVKKQINDNVQKDNKKKTSDVIDIHKDDKISLSNSKKIQKENIIEGVKNKTEEDKEKSSPLGSFFNKAQLIFKKIFDFIWYGNEKDVNDNSKDENIEEQSADNKKSENIQEMNNGDLENIDEKSEKFTSELLNKYRREREANFNENLSAAKKGVVGIPARNTSLLTTYDRFGRINKVAPSDSELILKGDKSIKM